MAMTPEAKVKKMCRDILVAEGVYFFSPAANGYGRAGIPDIICCVRGRFLAIECKAGAGKLTALQMREISSVVEHGGVAIIARENDAEHVRRAVRVLKDMEEIK